MRAEWLVMPPYLVLFAFKKSNIGDNLFFYFSMNIDIFFFYSTIAIMYLKSEVYKAGRHQMKVQLVKQSSKNPPTSCLSDAHAALLWASQRHSPHLCNLLELENIHIIIPHFTMGAPVITKSLLSPQKNINTRSPFSPQSPSSPFTSVSSEPPSHQYLYSRSLITSESSEHPNIRVRSRTGLDGD